jgi:hypothetical protein
MQWIQSIAEDFIFKMKKKECGGESTVCTTKSS